MNTIFDIEQKQDTPEKLAAAAGKPTKHFLFAGEFNKIVETIKNFINLLQNYNKYATDETVIGKWHNGKPIYRKVILGVEVKALNTGFLIPINNAINGIVDLDTFIDITGLVVQAESEYNEPLKGNKIPNIIKVNNKIEIACYYNHYLQGVTGYIFDIENNAYSTGIFDIILEYTKLSD